MVAEVQRELSPFTLQLDHIVEINPQCGGFYFAFMDQGQVVYDTLPLINRVNGHRIKPGRFHLSAHVVDRLRTKRYKRWYYVDRDYLYPLKKETYQRFVDRFFCIETDDNVCHQQTVILQPDPMHLRKKPLLTHRVNPPLWDDHLATLRQEEPA